MASCAGEERLATGVRQSIATQRQTEEHLLAKSCAGSSVSHALTSRHWLYLGSLHLRVSSIRLPSLASTVPGHQQAGSPVYQVDVCSGLSRRG